MLKAIHGLVAIVISLLSGACFLRAPEPENAQVFVLLINANSQNEGIYTIDREGTQEVLMFEIRSDAEAYNAELKKLNFKGLTVEQIDKWEVDQFCQAQQYQCTLYDRQAKPLPPKNHQKNDFN